MTAARGLEATAVEAATSTPSTRRRRSWLRRLIYITLVLAVVATAGLGGAAWYFSSQLLDVAPHRLSYSQRILALHGNLAVLTRTEDSARSEVDGLVWSGGRTIVGPVIASSRTSVTRRIIGSVAGLRPAIAVALDDHVYTSPAALHLKYRTVNVPDPLGPMPAWYVPGSSTTWAVLVHGYTSDRADWLRSLPTVVHLGLPALLVSYRNDVGAPSSSDHLYHLGATEWQDLEAGVRYALAHGAHSVILLGSSMGGNVVESFLHHSGSASRVRGVVLDAPVLDWNAVLDLAAAKRHLPAPLTALAKRMVAFRIGLSSLDSINQVKLTRDLKAPTLVFHGTADTTAPISVSAAFASARPDMVSLVRVPGAGHTESWNVDPERYTATLRSFIGRVLR